MIKESMMFLYFCGNCRAALKFYASVFGAEIIERTTYGEAEMEVDEAEKDLVMNSTMVLGGMKVCAGDVLGGSELVDGNRLSFWLELEDREGLESVYKRFLQPDCKVLTAKDTTFWESVYAKVEDPFGIIWELNCQKR